MQVGFKDYLREAFHAKPLGMFVSPNWIGLAAFGLLGFLNPGFWLLGAGAELAYLRFMTSNKRFRKWVDARLAGQSRDEWNEKLADRVKRLAPPEASRFRALENRCQSILEHQKTSGTLPDLQLQAEGLGRLLWIYLGLLQARQRLHAALAESGSDAAEKLERLEYQLSQQEDAQVRQSLEGQIEILRQRAATQKEAHAKVDFLEAELGRLEQQVELIREQSLLATDAGTVSQRIDEVGATLRDTTQWMREQQKMAGEVQDILEDAPPIPLPQSQ